MQYAKQITVHLVYFLIQNFLIINNLLPDLQYIYMMMKSVLLKMYF